MGVHGRLRATNGRPYGKGIEILYFSAFLLLARKIFGRPRQ